MTKEVENKGKPKLIEVGKATPEQIEAWKKEHKDPSDETGIIQELAVKVNDNEISYGYLKEPERAVLSRAMSLYKEKSPLDSGLLLLEACWIDGDPRMLKVKRINQTACIQANKTIEWLDSESKKY